MSRSKGRRKPTFWKLLIREVVFPPLKFLTCILFIPIVPILLAILPFLLAGKFVEHRIYLRRNQGRLFLIATRKRGWFDFIENNVLPIMPSGITLLWAEKADLKWPPLAPFCHFPEKNRPRARPFLARVTSRRVELIPLHDALKALKAAMRKRDPSTQRAVSLILEEKLVPFLAINK